jgi:hypothetical protein
MTNAVVLAQGAGVNLTNRNRIINGDMRIDQRNAGASVTNDSADLKFAVDRTNIYGTVSSKFTAQQNAGSVTPPAGFSNYLGCTSSSAYTVGANENFWVQHRIEGYNVADLDWGTANAKTVTLSFWVRSSLTGTFGGSFQNSALNRSYPFTYTINTANTWEQKTVTVVGDTSGTWLTTNGVGIIVTWGLGIGSSRSGTAGAWTGTSNIYSATGATSVVGTSGATFYITGVQLEAGSVATPFERRQYGQELALCQRYYQKFEGDADSSFSLASVWTTTKFFAVRAFPPMRALPDGSFSSTAALQFFSASSAKTSTDISVTSFSNASCEVLGTASSMTPGASGFVRFTAGGWIDLSAEL